MAAPPILDVCDSFLKIFNVNIPRIQRLMLDLRAVYYLTHPSRYPPQSNGTVGADPFELIVVDNLTANFLE